MPDTLASTERLQSLWYTRCSVPTPVSLAALSGWLDEEFAPDGIEVKSLRESSDADERASHFEHTLPDSFRQGGSVPPIWARSRGQDTRVIALTWTDEYQAIIALPGSGIATLKDLRGRRIGLPKHRITVDHNRASALRAFLILLDSVGLGPKDVDWVDLPNAAPDASIVGADGVSRGGWGRRHSYTDEVYALARGQVDAVYVKDVRGAEIANLLGAVVVADIGFHPDPLVRVSNCAPRPLTINAETLRNHPDIVNRFLARAAAAGEWAESHPDETVTLISRETGWSERWIRQAYGPQVHLHLTADLRDDWIDGFDHFKNFLFTNGFIPNDFDTRSWIDPAPFEAVRRTAGRKAA